MSNLINDEKSCLSADLINERETTGTLENWLAIIGVAVHWRNSQKRVYKKYTFFMRSKGLCCDCLTTGHMTRKCRNIFKCLTCCSSHHSVFQDPNFTINKKEHTWTSSTYSYRSNNCQTFTDSSTSVLVMIKGPVANLCDGNNPNEIKAEGQELL